MILITLSAIPIAVFCIVMRVSGQGLLDRHVNEQWSEGFAHQFAGMMMLIPGFLLILLTGWILDQIFIEEAEAEPAPAGAAARDPKKTAQWQLRQEKAPLAVQEKFAPKPKTAMEKTVAPSTTKPPVARPNANSAGNGATSAAPSTRPATAIPARAPALKQTAQVP